MIFSMLKYAILNIGRHKQRSLLAGTALVAAMTSLIVLFGYIEWVNVYLSSNTIFLNRNGHISIYPKNWEQHFRKHSKESIISKNLLNELDHQFSNHPMVKHTSDSLKALGFLNSEEDSFGVILKGFDPKQDLLSKKEIDVINWHLDSIDKYFPQTQLQSDQTVAPLFLTSELKKKFRNSDQIQFQVISQTVDRSLNVIEAEYVGAFSTGLIFDEEYSVSIPVKDLSDLLQTDGRTARHYYLFNYKDTQAFYSELQSWIKGQNLPLEVRSYDDERVSYYYAGSKKFLQFLGTFFSVIFFLVIVSILASVLYFSVIERSSESGTLLTIGYSTQYLKSIFLIEFLLILLVSYLGSLVLSLLIIYLTNHVIYIPFSPPGIIGTIQFKLILNFKNSLNLFIAIVVLVWILTHFLLKNQFRQTAIELLKDQES